MSLGASPSSRTGSQPFDEAVSSAVADANVKSHAISPDVIEEITRSVIQKLQTTGLDNLTQKSQPAQVFPPPPSQATPLSASTANSTSPTLPHRVLTPPSPHKQPAYLAPTERVTSPYRSDAQAVLSPIRPASPITSQDSESDVEHSEKVRRRPKGPRRLDTGMEETTLEKIWGALFDEHGISTPRLSQFLRGLAIHIIEDFEPRHSLVVTPDKMLKYYKSVALNHEIYPWAVIFDDETSSISRLYRALSCSHHLVQEYHDERPDIPGLTPAGFETFTTLLIRADPDAEYERLTKALLHMPIDNPDNKRERFPKEVTRRLFPSFPDLSIRYRIEDAMIEHASIEISRPRQSLRDDAGERQTSPVRKKATSVSFAEPKAVQEPDVARHPPPKAAPHSIVSEEENDSETVAKPIERERKPYVAEPGKGRNFHETPDETPRETSTRTRNDSVANDTRARADSTTAHARPIPINPNIQQMPKPEIHQSYKQRSPSFGQSGEQRRPDLDVHNSYASSLPRHSSAAPPVFDETDTKRYFDNKARDSVRRKADEDSRAYGESPRRQSSLRPKRTDYSNEDDYWRAREKRDRSYDDEGSYR